MVPILELLGVLDRVIDDSLEDTILVQKSYAFIHDAVLGSFVLAEKLQ